MSSRGEKVYAQQDLNSAHTVLISPGYFNRGQFPPPYLMDFGPPNHSSQVAILKNKQNESISVLLASDHTHYPNRTVKSSSHIVYGPVAAVATLDMQEPGSGFDQVALRTREQMQSSCNEVGLTKNPNTQLAGASVVVEVDSSRSDLAHDPEIQNGFGYLFSPHGPYGRIMIIPQIGQDNLMMNIEKAGGKVAWQGLHLHDDYFKIRERIHEILLERWGQRDVHSLLSALMGYIPIYAHLYNLQMQKSETFEVEKISDQQKFVLDCIQNHIPASIPSLFSP